MPRKSEYWVPGKSRRLTPKVRAFFEALGGPAKLNATEAARMAFSGNPRTANRMAVEMKRKWPDLFAETEERYLEKIRMTDAELDEHLSEISRDREHKDRLRALELIARMKGRLNDKLKVEIDRKSMLRDVEQLLLLLPRPKELAPGPSETEDKTPN